MEKNLYFVYVLNGKGHLIGEKLVCDNEHLEECIKSVKSDYGVAKVYINEATFCSRGYLVQGDRIDYR